VWIRFPSDLATSSSRAAARISLGAVLWLAAASHLSAKVFLSQEEALKEVFGPGAAPRRSTAYLTEDEAKRIESAAGTAPSSRVIVYYTGGPDPNRILSVFFDTHIVRTLPETIMVVVSPEGRAERVEILSFDEPEDYLPKRRWLDQFGDRPLGGDLSLKAGIRAVTGATLSSVAITDAVRRTLAAWAILAAPPAKAGGAP
jgi:FMN-binding protein